MITAKPPTPLAGSVSIHLPAFKRKRIEQWCDDVAQYLKSGSLCRSVIGHVIEDNRLSNGIVSNGSGTKSAPTSGLVNQRTYTTTTTNNNTTIVHSTAASASAAATIGHLTEMLSIHSKAEPNGNNPCFRVTKIDTTAPPAAGGRGGTPMPDTSGALPVVKFSYGHYNEQRRRIDRLVQGLPVLSASASSAAGGATPNQGSTAGQDRLPGTGGAGGEEHPPSSGLSRAERTCRSPSRGVSPAPAAAPTTTAAESARCASRASSTGDPRAQRVPRPSGGASQQSRTGPSVSPSPTRSHPVYPGSSSSHHHYPYTTTTTNNNNSSSNGPHTKTSSAEIVVIEDEAYLHSHHGNGFNKASGFSSLNFDAGSPVLKRSQSQRVHKARQRMLAGTRRSRDTGGHLPVQSCWSMAELTW